MARPISEKFQMLGLSVNRASHNPFNIAAIVLSFLIFIVAIFINAAAAGGSFGIFSNATNVISNNNEVDLTPAGWTFSTWGIIYTWQALWLVYNVATIFIRTENGPLYQNPPVLTIVFHLFYTLNFVFNIVWLFLFDKEQFVAGFFVILLLTASVYSAAILSHINILDAEPFLNKGKGKVYLWLYRILVNNGLVFYGTWVTVASLLNFAIALTYEWKSCSRDTASVVSASIIAVVITVVFILEIFVFEKYMRWTFSHYLQMIIAFAGILSKHWASQSTSAIFTLVLLILGPGIFLLTKIVVTVYRSKASRRSNF